MLSGRLRVRFLWFARHGWKLQVVFATCRDAKQFILDLTEDFRVAVHD